MVFKSAQALVASESTVMGISTWTPPLAAHGEEPAAAAAAAVEVAAEETSIEEEEARAHREVLQQIDREDTEGAGQ